MLLYRIYSALPPAVRAKGKALLGASGHSRGTLDRLKARKDALGKKRLDRSLESVIDTLGPGYLAHLTGARAVEFGAGYVPMDSVSMWLLGAREVTAVDYNDIADFRALTVGVQRADMTAVRRLLAAAAPEGDWETRLDAVLAGARRGSLMGAVPLIYLGSLDVIADPAALPVHDFLWSVSVLEHIRPSQLDLLLEALRSRKAPGAAHVHAVDLRDHHDFDAAPYAFLASDAAFDPETDCDVRGNGMTVRDWNVVLAAHPELGLTVVRSTPGRPHLLPMGLARPLTDAEVADSITIAGAVDEIL